MPNVVDVDKGQRVWLAVCDDHHVLFGRRGVSCNHAGQWGLFGGRVDECEFPYQAVFREFKEETAYKAQDGETVVQVKRKVIKSKDCIWYKMSVPSVTSLLTKMLLTREVDDYRVIPLEYYQEDRTALQLPSGEILPLHYGAKYCDKSVLTNVRLSRF